MKIHHTKDINRIDKTTNVTQGEINNILLHKCGLFQDLFSYKVYSESMTSLFFLQFPVSAILPKYYLMFMTLVLYDPDFETYVSKTLIVVLCRPLHVHIIKTVKITSRHNII